MTFRPECLVNILEQYDFKVVKILEIISLFYKTALHLWYYKYGFSVRVETWILSLLRFSILHYWKINGFWWAAVSVGSCEYCCYRYMKAWKKYSRSLSNWVSGILTLWWQHWEESWTAWAWLVPDQSSYCVVQTILSLSFFIPRLFLFASNYYWTII